MAGFDHHGSDEQELHDPLTVARNTRYGLILFTVYLAFYVGFMFLNAFRPESMESTPLAGINLAVLYGLGLIVGALILSLVYGWLCREPATPPSQDGEKRFGGGL